MTGNMHLLLCIFLGSAIFSVNFYNRIESNCCLQGVNRGRVVVLFILNTVGQSLFKSTQFLNKLYNFIFSNYIWLIFIIYFKASNLNSYPGLLVLKTFSLYMYKGNVKMFKVKKLYVKKFAKDFVKNSTHIDPTNEKQVFFANDYVNKNFVLHFSLLLNWKNLGNNKVEALTVGLSSKPHIVKINLGSTNYSKVTKIGIQYKQINFMSESQAYSTVLTQTIMSEDMLNEGIKEGETSYVGGQGLYELRNNVEVKGLDEVIDYDKFIEHGVYKEGFTANKLIEKWEE